MPTKHLPARMESLQEGMAFVTEQAQKKGFSEESISSVCLAVEEALVNVFNHAYAAGAGDVEVRVNASDGPLLTVEVRDSGIAFNPLSLPEPDVKADIAERKVGGLGVFLIRRMSDNLQYRRENDSNILTITFSDHRGDARVSDGGEQE